MSSYYSRGDYIAAQALTENSIMPPLEHFEVDVNDKDRFVMRAKTRENIVGHAIHVVECYFAARRLRRIQERLGKTSVAPVDFAHEVKSAYEQALYEKIPLGRKTHEFQNTAAKGPAAGQPDYRQHGRPMPEEFIAAAMTWLYDSRRRATGNQEYATIDEVNSQVLATIVAEMKWEGASADSDIEAFIYKQLAVYTVKLPG